MEIESVKVGMLPCPDYDRQEIGKCFEGICSSLSWLPPRGTKVLLKPNLVMARGHQGLACTHPEFVAAAARFFLDCGLKVAVGDSPAFGSSRQVMDSCGILEALKGLDVKAVNLTAGPGVELAGGRKVVLAREAFETDLIVNLPRIKAHAQFGITLAVKNLFGLVMAWRKWLLHQSLGRDIDRFLAMLTDILEVVPDTFTLLDGITAMQGTGPVRGYPFQSGITVGSWNPVALETSVLRALSLEPETALLTREYLRRKYHGATAREIDYTLFTAEDLAGSGFDVPGRLKPVFFSVKDSLNSLKQRGAATIDGCLRR